MLVFIWNAFDEGAARRTEACVRSARPGCRCVRLTRGAASVMNRELRGCGDAFFLVLEAGDVFEPEFLASATVLLDSLGPRDAGIEVVPEEAPGAGRPAAIPPGAPVFWRTAAVMDERPESGFPEADSQPFEHYALMDKKLQLDSDWSWVALRTNSYRSSGRREPRWKKPDREREYLSPIIHGRPSPHTAADDIFLTVVICTYNDAAYLPWAVRSVIVQTAGDWELVIVDDGSTDRTRDVLRQCRYMRDSRIRTIRREANGGKSAALNDALAAARGRWLLELDADDWLAPDCVERLRRCADRASEQIGALYAGHAEWRERADRRLILGGQRMAAESSADRLLNEPDALAPRMYRVSALRQMGGWLATDPFGGRLYEDVQMLIRMMRERPVAPVPGILYHRRIRRSSMTQRNKACYDRWKTWMADLAADRSGSHG